MRRCGRIGESKSAGCSLPAQAYLVERLENRTLFAVGTLVGTSVNLNSTVGPDAADSVRNVAYVADQGNSQILAIDTNNGTLAATAPTVGTVQGLAVSVNDNLLYASEPGAFQVEVFSLPNLTLLRTLNSGIAVNQIVALANNRFAGMDSSGIQIFDDTTGAALFTLTADFNGLLRASIDGTTLYSRGRGIFGNPSIREFDTSGVGAPAPLANIPGVFTANPTPTDFTVNPGAGFAYFGDGSSTGGVEVTLISSGSQTTYPGTAVDAVAAFDGDPFVYGIQLDGNVLQYDRQGVIQNTLQTMGGHTPESLVETPNGVLIYTFNTGVGIINESALDLTTLPHLVFKSEPSSLISGQVMAPAVQVAIEDGAGNVLINNTSQVTLSLVGGGGTLGGTTTVAALNGIATFPNLTEVGAGTFSLQATDGADTAARSTSFFVTGTLLVFQRFPTDVVAGAAIAPAFSVAIEDQSGHILTGDESPVSIFLASGSGSLSGTLTANAILGVATFSDVIVDGTGQHVLRAQDGTDVPQLSPSFNVTTSLSEDHLVFLQQPTNVVQGAAINPPVQVEVEDINNNLVSTNAGITLSVSSGPGVVGGSPTVNAFDGIATFSDLEFSTVGAYTLAAAGAGAAPAVSTGFDVGYRLVFAQSPLSVVAGQKIAATVIVDVLDQNNNLVTSPNTQVTLTVASGPSSLGGKTTVTSVNGEAIFTGLTLPKSGSYTLTATDNGISTTSNSFSAVAATPVKLAFVNQPAEDAGGQVDSALALEDSLGDIVTGFRSSIRVTVAGPQGTRRRSFTFNTVKGLVKFSHLKLTIPGTYTMTATDSRIRTMVVSNSFNFTPLAPAVRRNADSR